MSLSYELKQLAYRNADGSKGTQAGRLKTLLLAGRQLKDLGYRHLKAISLKPKHVAALVKLWKEQEVSNGTMKNRLAHLRWWAEKIGKADMLPKGNEAYEVERRVYVAAVSKAISIDDRLNKITDQRLRTSLELQQAFGLRREECLKFQPAFADQGTTLMLKASWTKGGQAREIPIRTDEQRRVLADAHRVAGKGSMIPPERTYVEWMKKYERDCLKAGIHRAHGLRHAYAQTRYEELAGWKSPAAGGPKYAELNSEQRKLDRMVRLRISNELGHHRVTVTSVYLGR